ncbi:uncharacterized protein [Melopsittacus undulatus]|uniref:uncharacterized protein isoform X7 n=1 Tax=Melopsittacus undulatus TaxID=13146 RepID=UPI00146B439A|nr:uncharacterized protein LOC117438423 isoform X7 [Melopsittacus undulatus]
MAPIKWHQCTPPPCPPLSPLSPWRRRAALPPSRLPPLSSRLLLPHLSLHLLHGRPMAAGGAGRGGRGQEEEGNRVVPGGADTSHCPPRRARLSPDRHGSARPRVEPGHRGGLGQAGSRRGAVAGGRRCCPGLQRGPCPPSHPSCRRHSCSPRPLRVTVSTATAAAAAAARTRHPPPARRHHRGLWEQRAAMCTLCVPEQTLSRAPEDFFSLFLSSARPKRKERFLQLGSRRRERSDKTSPVP